VFRSLTVATGATAVRSVLTLDAEASAANNAWKLGCASSGGGRLSRTCGGEVET